MKSHFMLPIILLLIYVLSSSQILGETIWSEDFSSCVDGTGIDGTGNLGDYPDGVSKWSLDVTSATLEDAGDYCKTVSGVLEIQNPDGDMIWLSESIDVSGYTNVSFSLDAAEIGDHEGTDYFNVEYKIDSGSFTLITNWNSKGDDTHTLFDNWDSETISVSSLSGSSLQIKITMNNNADTEQMQLDNVTVTGSSGETTVQFSSSSASVTESAGTYNLNVSITNPDESNATTAQVVLTSGSASDVNNYTTQSILFPAVSSADQTVTITITDDSELEGDEDLVFSLQNVIGGNSATVGSPSSFTLTIEDNDIPNFVINEIHADPDATNGDANGDGVVGTYDDEFVEIVNRSGSTVDISGWKLYDRVGLKHTIPTSTILGNNVALVVFGGGAPTGIPGIVQTATSGALDLNNAGDDVIFKNSSDITIASYTYGSEGGDDQSIARSPDFTGSFVKHSTITENPVLFSPGKMNAVDDQSLPVELQDFNAVPGNSKVTLCWSTGSEIENLGFNLYRSTNNNGEFLMLNAELIPGHGSTSEMHEYSYTDHNVVNGVTYFYKIEDVDYAGTAKLHDVIVSATPSGKEESTLVEGFRLQPCFPNPFNPETTLRFELGEAADISVRVYDVRGKLVRTLTNSRYLPGEYSILWNGTDFKNQAIASGIYLIQTQSSTGFSRSDKVIYLR